MINAYDNPRAFEMNKIEHGAILYVGKRGGWLEVKFDENFYQDVKKNYLDWTIDARGEIVNINNRSQTFYMYLFNSKPIIQEFVDGNKYNLRSDNMTHTSIGI